MIINITSFLNAEDVEIFSVQKNGVDFNISTVTKIEVYIIERLLGGIVSIDSDTTDVVLSGINLSIKFSKLIVPEGVYYPKIKMYDTENPNGTVIIGPGKKTEIKLTVKS